MGGGREREREGEGEDKPWVGLPTVPSAPHSG